MLDEFFRYEVNKKVRQILISHHVDMTKINYSCTGNTIYVYGSLNKSPQGDFSLATIEGLVAELMSLPHIRDIQFDLDNWFISSEAGALNITKMKKPSSVQTEQQKPLEIDKSEPIRDVLKDIKQKD
jgi:hypothetical protein